MDPNFALAVVAVAGIVVVGLIVVALVVAILFGKDQVAKMLAASLHAVVKKIPKG